MIKVLSVFFLSITCFTSLVIAQDGGPIEQTTASIETRETRETSATVLDTIEIGKEIATKASLKNLQPFPDPKSGEKKIVIHLPKATKETDLEVEILIGKLMQVDNCNYFRIINGSLQEEDLEGWGYSFLSAKVGIEMGSTMIACNEEQKSTEFVAAASSRIRYNSRLPIVIYSDKDVIVKYRVWKASEEFKEINPTQ